MPAALRPLWLVVVAVACAVLLWQVVTVNRARGCALADTPYLDWCRPVPEVGSPAHLARLRTRIAQNPGDAGAYALLAFFSTGPARWTLLEAARALAPNDPNVLRMRAAHALEAGRLAEAVDSLVQIAQYYHHSNPEAARALGDLIVAGSGVPLLRPHLRPGTTWLSAVMDQMIGRSLPIGAALPLVVEAGNKGILSPLLLQGYTAMLKAAGNWGDAYGLWIGLHGRPVPILYNPGFDLPFQPNGFDWEVPQVSPARAGAVVERSRLTGRGHVLDVLYTGRAIASPAIRQYLFLAPGRYRLRGLYMTARLRSEKGLGWVVRCVAEPSATAGKSPALMDTQGSWEAFQFDIHIPPACGSVASLQLETFAAAEAAAGFRGRVSFDAFSLEPRGS